MSNICKQDTDKVLLVEGDNDCHVVMALCAAHNVPETFGIYQCNSDTGVLKRLNALIIRPNPPHLISCTSTYKFLIFNKHVSNITD